jgi:hypothetical protein
LRTPSRLPLDATAISLVTRAGSRLLIYRGGPDELAASAWSRATARLPTRHLVHARLDQADRHDHGPVHHREVETSPNRFSVVNGETNQHGRTAWSVSAVAERYRAARRTDAGPSSTSCARGWAGIVNMRCVRSNSMRRRTGSSGCARINCCERPTHLFFAVGRGMRQTARSHAHVIQSVRAGRETAQPSSL